MIPRVEVLETFACPVLLRTNILRFGPAGYDIYSDEQVAAMKRGAEAHDELLFAVCRKFEGESRHQTALRYIREAEEMPRRNPACDASPNQ